jgi:uncharacterized protein (DUF983 family)
MAACRIGMIGRLWKALRTAAQLGCPVCGQRTLFRSMFSMNERCAVCGIVFEREPGYFIGAIYINYAVTTVLSVTGFLLLDAYTEISLTTQLLIWSAFGIAFPLLFFRYSKSLWLAIGHLVNPDEPPVRLVHDRR